MCIRDSLELVIDYDIEEIESQGEIVTVICKPDNFLNIKEILKIVSRMGVNRLLVEGGARVWTSFLKAGLFDEIVMFTGNKIINDSATSCFNDFLPLDSRLRDFPNLTLTSLLRWKDNIEAKWIANS